jgi:hypothetical protein
MATISFPVTRTERSNPSHSKNSSSRKSKGFYNKIKTKRGFAKAIVATARKLLTIVYYTLKNGWYFTDFVNNIREIRPIEKRVLGVI